MIYRSLKSIPPLSARRRDGGIDKQKIEVLYPPSVIEEKNVSTILQRLSTERNQIHRTRMIWSIVGMPIVAPFAIVPVIPNVWRPVLIPVGIQILIQRNSIDTLLLSPL